MLPDDFTFDIQISNPIFSNDGASSIATTLPATNENCKLLGRPERLARAQRPVRLFQTVLRHGIFQKRCSLIVGGCSKTEGIEVALAFEESEMYADLKDQNIKDIFQKKTVSSEDLDSSSMSSLMNDLYWSYYKSSDIHENFAIFPCGIEKTDTSVSVLNEINGSSFVYSARTITSGGKSIYVPNGYGMTVFLWLHRAIRLLFELSGYQVVRNDFEELPFSQIVLVNNCSDTFCKTPKASFRDLVPSVKVEEFILWLYDKFGAAVSVSGKSVKILLQQKAISSPHDIDLSVYVRGMPDIHYPLPTRTVLNCDTSLDMASPPDETLPLFRQKHDTVVSLVLGEDPEANGIVFRKQTGNYTHISGYISENNYSESLLGSNCWKYDRDNAEESEEYEACDRYLPTVIIRGSLMPYIGERLHYNTSIANQEEETTQPIQICYAFWNGSEWIGSTQPYTYDGDIIEYSDGKSFPELTPEGLYPLCWSGYNNIILNGAPEIELQIDFPPSLLMSMDICVPKLINGVKVMIKNMSYHVSSSGIEFGKSLLQVIPAYHDQIVDTQIDFSQGSFRWVPENNKEEAIRAHVNSYESYQISATDGLTDYTVESAPPVEPYTSGIKIMIRTRWIYINILYGGTSVKQVQVTYEEYFISKRKDSE